MLYKYLSFSISIVFISWLIGMIVNAFLRKTAFYDQKLSTLNFVRSDLWNTLLGVGLVKWMIKNTFFKFFNQKLKLKRKVDLSDISKLRAEMTISEIDHLIGFLFMGAFAVVKLVHGNILFGAVIMLVNIFMNLHPSLVQPQNKRRIDQLLSRQNQFKLHR